jgi:hypothetical protein
VDHEAFSAAHSSSVKSRERIRNRTPSGDSTENPAAALRHHARTDDLASKVQHLLQLDTHSLPDTGSDIVQETGTWFTAAAHAGSPLHGLAGRGQLCRGLRAVLARHVVFHWNRLGLPTDTRTVLARAATTAVLGPHPDTAEHRGPR